MAKSYHNNKNIKIKNFALYKVHYGEQQLLKNDTDNHKINSISKFTKEQEYKSFLGKNY